MIFTEIKFTNVKNLKYVFYTEPIYGKLETYTCNRISDFVKICRQFLLMKWNP